MGVFTRITDAAGNTVQIKFSNDVCKTYSVGQEVDFYVNPHRVGSEQMLDGIYDGDVENGPHEYGFVVIKDHVIQELVLAPNDPDERGDVEEALYEKWGPFTEYRSLFTPEAWEEHLRREKEARERSEREYQAWLAARGKTPETATLVDAMVFPIATSWNYQSIGKRMLIVDEQ